MCPWVCVMIQRLKNGKSVVRISLLRTFQDISDVGIEPFSGPARLAKVDLDHLPETGDHAFSFGCKIIQTENGYG